MTAPAFTPGPWVYQSDVQAVGKGVRAGKIALVSIAFKGSAERDANGFLIAAAPDLYRALEKLVAHLNDRIDVACKHTPDQVPVFFGIAEAHDALAKARGEF